MQLYRWRARNETGLLMQGEYMANSPEEVADFIRRNYGWVTGIRPAAQPRLFVWPGWARSSPGPLQKANFYRQLAVLLRSGIPLLTALHLMEQKPTLQLGRCCQQLQLELRRGKAFSQALAGQVRLFGAIDVALTQAGEASGQLENTLQALADYYERRHSLKRYLQNTCAYPVFLLVLTVVTLLFFMIKILPLFASLFDSLGISAGRLLQLLLALGQLPQEHAPQLITGLLACFGLLYLFQDPLWRLLVRLPPVRKARWQLEEIAFVQLLGLLLRSGVTLPEALPLAGSVVVDPVARQKLARIRDGVLRGMSLTEATGLAGQLFSTLVVEFIHSGENSGELADMLAECASILQKELQSRIQAIKTLLEPLLILIVAAVILAMVITVLGPLFQLIDAMPG